MARSETVWIVEYDGSIDAAFTVKHELRSYLHKHESEWGSMRVWRVPDGGSIVPKRPIRWLSIGEIIG